MSILKFNVFERRCGGCNLEGENGTAQKRLEMIGYSQNFFRHGNQLVKATEQKMNKITILGEYCAVTSEPVQATI